MMQTIDVEEFRIALAEGHKVSPVRRLLAAADAADQPEELNGYHLVTAITQDTLNYQMKALWQRNIIHRTLHRELDDTGVSIDAELDPPTVKLGISAEPSQVLFTLRLRRGTLTYYEGFGPKAVKHELPFTGWRFSFRVNLNLQAIERNALQTGHTVPDEVKASLNQFSDDQFTIRHLFMDFQDANLADFDPTETELGLPNGARITTAQLEQLQSTLLSWFRWIKGTGNPYILGYSVENKTKPDSPPALLSPTRTTFTTVPDSTRAGNSCLLFLSMTGDSPLPDETHASKFRSSFRVADADGSMTVSSKVFLGKYIEPVVLPAIANALKPSEPFAPVGDLSTFKTTLAGQLHQEGLDDAKLQKLFPGITCKPGWWARHFYDNINDNDGDGNHGYGWHVSNDSGILKIYEEVRTKRTCFVFFDDGTDVVLKGGGLLWENIEFYEYPFNAKTWMATISTQQPLGFAARLKAGTDGKLVFNLEIVETQVTQESDRNFIVKIADSLAGLWNGGMDKSMNGLKTRSQQWVTDMNQHVTSALGGQLERLQNMVVLPAGSVFFFKNASFDDQRNLRLDVTYKMDR